MKWCYLLLALIVSFASFSQRMPADYVDADTTKTDTTEVNTLLALSKNYQWIDSYQSLSLANRALKLAQDLDYKEGIAVANNLKGFCFWSFGDNDLAIQSAMEALEIVRDRNYPLIQAESYYILARGYMDVAEQKIANESIQKAEALANKGQDWELLCSIYNLRGVILYIALRLLKQGKNMLLILSTFQGSYRTSVSAMPLKIQRSLWTIIIER
jgi:tetratricopeptide (TPR) repeat protein